MRTGGEVKNFRKWGGGGYRFGWYFCWWGGRGGSVPPLLTMHLVSFTENHGVQGKKWFLLTMFINKSNLLAHAQFCEVRIVSLEVCLL